MGKVTVSVCKNGVRGGFPANLTKGKTAPTVQDFEVTQHGEQTYENDILYNVSGLNISWKAPDNGKFFETHSVLTTWV